MYKLGPTYAYQSYSNVDPFEVNDSDHVIRIDGDIKAQLGSGAQLLSIDVAGDVIRLSLNLSSPSAPHEWPVGTTIHLVYYGAKIESNPINKESDMLSNVDRIHAYNIFKPQDVDKKNGYLLGVELQTDDGLWDILYNHGEVNVETVNQIDMFQVIKESDEDIQHKSFKSYELYRLLLKNHLFFSTEEIGKLSGITGDDGSWLIKADRNSKELGEMNQLRIVLQNEKIKFEVQKMPRAMFNAAGVIMYRNYNKVMTKFKESSTS